MTEPKPQGAMAGTLELPVFGWIEPEHVPAQDDLYGVVWDKFPVPPPGHALIIPRRPV